MKKPPLALILLVAALTLAGCSDSSTGADAPAKSDKAVTESSAAKPAKTPSPNEWYDDKYGSFKTIKKSGTGDAVIPLTSEVTAAVVTATHKGKANFSIQGLDKNNQPTIDLLVDTIGNYSGTTALGINSLGNATTSLKVSADGKWTISISPMASAKSIKIPVKGTGDGVFRYDGKAATWKISNTGEGNFVVNQTSESAMPNLGVNKIGNYRGSVPMLAGPSVVVINSDGNWSIE